MLSWSRRVSEYDDLSHRKYRNSLIINYFYIHDRMCMYKLYRKEIQPSPALASNSAINELIHQLIILNETNLLLALVSLDTANVILLKRLHVIDL